LSKLVNLTLPTVNHFNDLLDTSPCHNPQTCTKWQFNIITFRVAMADLTLATANAVQISKLEDKINCQKVNHLIDITNLHEQLSKGVDDKIDKISQQVANLIHVNRATSSKSRTSWNKIFWLPMCHPYSLQSQTRPWHSSP
jgi:hypothetical protein